MWITWTSTTVMYGLPLEVEPTHPGIIQQWFGPGRDRKLAYQLSFRVRTGHEWMDTLAWHTWEVTWPQVQSTQ